MTPSAAGLGCDVPTIDVLQLSTTVPGVLSDREVPDVAKPAAAACPRADENTPVARCNQGAEVLRAGQDLAGRAPPTQT